MSFDDGRWPPFSPTYDVLEADGGWLTVSAVVAATRQPYKTVHRTLNRLRRGGWVKSRPSPDSAAYNRLEWRAV